MDRANVFCMVAFLLAALSPDGLTGCPTNCECTSGATTCQNISEIPNSSQFPIPMWNLTIKDSPDLLEISANAFINQSDTLTELKIQRTGLKRMHQCSFSGLSRLKVLEITFADHLFDVGPRNLFSDLTNLSNLNLSFCANLDSLTWKVLNPLSNLESLDLRNSDFQELSDDTFLGTTNLKYLYMSSNENLEVLPKNLFANMFSLEEIYIERCGLNVLYPEHFESSFSSGSLQVVKGSSNDWICTSMCEFIGWMEDNPSFREITELGPCDHPYWVSTTEVTQLDQDDVCLDSGSAFITFVAVFCFMTLLLSACFCLAIKNCCYGMCSSPSNGNTSGRENDSRRRRNSRTSNAISATVSGINNNMSFEDGATEFSPEWQVTCIDPPSYDSIQPKPPKDDSANAAHSDSDSMDGIPPPPYEANTGSE